MVREIRHLAPKPASKEIALTQGSLDLGIERDAEVGGIGMGVLSDGTTYLKRVALAAPKLARTR